MTLFKCLTNLKQHSIEHSPLEKMGEQYMTNVNISRCVPGNCSEAVVVNVVFETNIGEIFFVPQLPLL